MSLSVNKSQFSYANQTSAKQQTPKVSFTAATVKNVLGAPIRELVQDGFLTQKGCLHVMSKLGEVVEPAMHKSQKEKRKVINAVISVLKRTNNAADTEKYLEQYDRFLNLISGDVESNQTIRKNVRKFNNELLKDTVKEIMEGLSDLQNVKGGSRHIKGFVPGNLRTHNSSKAVFNHLLKTNKIRKGENYNQQDHLHTIVDALVKPFMKN